MFTLLFFALGLAAGSFINAAAYRLSPASIFRGGVNSNRNSLVLGRSACTHCGEKLSWWQLIPVLSFIFLRSKCYYCKKSIALHYPVVELSTAFAFAALIFFNPNIVSTPLLLLLLLLAVSILVFISLYDFKEYLILDYTVLAGAVVGLGIALVRQDLILSLISAAALAGVFGGIYIFSKGTWIGLGDVKLAVAIGVLNGPLTLITLAFASWLGSLIGLFMILAGRGSLKTKLPFGTLLGISASIVLIWHQYIEYLISQFIY